MKISAIVLAAGESKRMGRNKLLLDIGRQTLIERVTEAVSNSQVDRVIVVTGFDRDSVRKKLVEKNVRVVYNRRYQEGMATSIREGLKHIDPEAHSVLIALGDQPLIGSRMIDQLIDAHRKASKGIACPTFRGRRGHPVIFDLEKYGKGLSELRGDIGGRKLLEAHTDDLLEVAVDCPGAIRDIDVWKDYEELLELMVRRSDRVDKGGKSDV